MSNEGSRVDYGVSVLMLVSGAYVKYFRTLQHENKWHDAAGKTLQRLRNAEGAHNLCVPTSQR